MTNEIWRILVIDDNPDDRADLRQMLLRDLDRRYGFTEVEVGAEGVRKVRDKQDGPDDCVLLGDCLPDMNAEQVLTALRDGAELPACPVVVTGSGQGDARKLLRAGAHDCIGKEWNMVDDKPIQVDEFMGTLDVALGLAKKEVARPAEQERA